MKLLGICLCGEICGSERVMLTAFGWENKLPGRATYNKEFSQEVST
jgi:hypothetical protein